MTPTAFDSICGRLLMFDDVSQGRYRVGFHCG
jgi:hypothetical protein